jgi:hypothetical protein
MISGAECGGSTLARHASNLKNGQSDLKVINTSPDKQTQLWPVL